MDKQLKVNKGALLSLGQYDSKFRSCYFFIKKLSSIPKHPIITNYPSKAKLFAKLMGTSEKRFISKMQAAFDYGLITTEGYNVRLMSIKSELNYFGLAKSRVIKTTPRQLKELYQDLSLNNNIKQQQTANLLKSRQDNSKNSRLNSGVQTDKASMPHMKQSEEFTLSLRNVCKITGYKSTRSASQMLERAVKQNKLKRTDNLFEITQGTYNHIMIRDKAHIPNLRKKLGKCYYQGANIYEIVKNPIASNVTPTPLTSEFKRDFSIPIVGSSYLYMNL